MKNLRFRVFLLGIVFACSLALLQLGGPSIGLQRDAGLWIWAAVFLAAGTILLGPVLVERMGDSRRAILVGVLTLLAGAAVYAYVTLFMAPNATSLAQGG